MKILNHVIFMLAISLVANAAKLDLATHNSLIQKLESAVGTESSDAMMLQTNMAYRLADLYAERARLLSMDQEGQGERIHATEIITDRKKAISILTKILPALDKSLKGPGLMQKAHLHVMLKQSDEAIKIFKQIERNPSLYDAKTVALVYIQLGDVAFLKGDFSASKSQFEKALKLKENPRRGYSAFRLAWVNYNQGKTQLAEKQLIQLLKSSDLFKSASEAADASFQEEVSHDLALFMAKNDILDSSIQTLSTLSPKSTRKKNLIFLASELDRTAKKVSALKVWRIVGTNEISFDDQLERQLQITRIEYDLGHKESLVKEIERTLLLLQNSKCIKSAECTVANQNLRRIVTDWAKAEERSPSIELISAFQKYTNSFEDFEMSYWAAQAAVQRKQYELAYQFHLQAIGILFALKEKNEIQNKMFNGSLLGILETAELSKKSDLRLQAYKKYLEINPNGVKSNEVKYQIAHWYYEKNDYLTAISEFRKIALDKNKPLDLREKAADLALDSDVLLKNESLLENHSLEFSQALPSKKDEYLIIYQKAILNQTAKVLNESKSDAALSTELKKLNGLQIAHFTLLLERQHLIKNKIELSYRLKDIESLMQNATSLLAIKKISHEDQEMALHHLAWIAEVKMNFKDAIHYLLKMKPLVKREEYFLKIATLQELANENPSVAYGKYLAISHDADKKSFAAHQIVLNSKKPMRLFKLYESLLMKNAHLYSSAGIYTFEQSKDVNFAQHLLIRSSVRKTFSGQLLTHLFALEQLKIELKGIARAQLKGSSDQVLKRNLVKRNKQLKKLEGLANKAIKDQDTSLQLIYLSQVANENNHLAQEILNLPAPRGLKVLEKKQYLTQVQTLVQPYLAEAQSIQHKNSELWTEALEKNSFNNLSECLVRKTKPGCQLAATEINFLRVSARLTGILKDPFEKLSEQRQKRLSETEFLKGRIKLNPFNLSDLAKLKELQSSLGYGPMVAYLDRRLTELQVKRVENAN